MKVITVKKIVSMIRNLSQSQTEDKPVAEERHTNQTSGRQIKKNNQPSFPYQDDC